MYHTRAAKANGACPHCGQPLPQIRCGVRMYPQTARVFDVIKGAGRDGIDGDALMERAYAGVRRPSYLTVKAHIWHIRQMLEDTDYRIETTSRGGRRKGIFRLVKVVKAQAFETVFSCK